MFATSEASYVACFVKSVFGRSIIQFQFRNHSSEIEEHPSRVALQFNSKRVTFLFFFNE